MNLTEKEKEILTQLNTSIDADDVLQKIEKRIDQTYDWMTSDYNDYHSIRNYREEVKTLRLRIVRYRRTI